MRIYIAGPMTGHPEFNFPAFHAAAVLLREQGHDVVSPAEINPDHSKSWRECMRSDIRELTTCDSIYMLPGFESSKGASLERHIAMELGLAVIYAPAFTGGAVKQSNDAGIPHG